MAAQSAIGTTATTPRRVTRNPGGLML